MTEKKTDYQYFPVAYGCRSESDLLTLQLTAQDWIALREHLIKDADVEGYGAVTDVLDAAGYDEDDHVLHGRWSEAIASDEQAPAHANLYATLRVANAIGEALRACGWSYEPVYGINDPRGEV